MTIRQRAGWYIVSPGVTLALDPYRPEPAGARVYLPSAALAEQLQILGRVHIEGESPQAAPAPVPYWRGQGGVIPWENATGADIAAGTPVDLGGVYGFALADIPNSVTGRLALSGVWEFPLPDGVDFLAGDFVCVDGGAVSASGEPVGIAAADSAEGRVRVHLLPGTGGGGGTGDTVRWDRITGKPDFATVATSGDYNDLINTPPGGGGASVKIKAGPGIKVESALNALGKTEYTISLDLALESETPDLLTITEKKENNP